MTTETISTPGGFIRVEGTEARVARLLAQRQSVGIRKYGLTVEHNPLSTRQWVQHALEESLDLSVYLMRILEDLDKADMGESHNEPMWASQLGRYGISADHDCNGKGGEQC